MASTVEPEEDEEASFLAVHAAHTRDFEHADINMDPAIARDPHDPEPEDLVDQHTDTESSYEPSLVARPPRRDHWRSTMIYAIDMDAVVRVLDWDDYHLMQNSIAAAVHVDVVDLLNFHHVETQPQDLRRANVEAVIAHRVHDVQPGDQRPLVLLDVEFHSNNPQHPPETVRKVHKISDMISRQRLLEVLGLQPFCRRSRNRCLLWVNDALIPLRSKLIHLQDGDYVRVAIPPGGPRIDHIATRCLASAFSQGYTVSEILERHTLYLLGWYDTIIGPPHVPLPFYQDDSDVHTLFQHAHAQHIPELDQGLPELCNWHVWGQEQIAAVSARLEDEDEPLSESPRLSHWHRRAQDHDENDIERQPPIVQELFMTMAHFAANNPPEDEGELVVHTWYLDGHRHLKCDTPRDLTLRRDFSTWMRQILEVWQDHMEPSQAVQIFLVRPSPPLTHRQRSQAAHLILAQHLPLDGFANLFTIVTASSEVLQFAKFAPAIMHKHNVVISAETAEACLPIVRDTSCMTWHGDFEIRARVAIRNRHGLSFLVIINNEFDRAASSLTNPWEEDQPDAASFLQRHTHKTVLNLDALLPQKVAVQLLDGTGTRQLPTPLEVDAPGTTTQVAAELQLWGHRCQVFANEYQARLLCIPEHTATEDEDSGLHHYWFCHDDPDDPEGTFLHSAMHEMSEIELMSFLCSLGYPRAVILEQRQLCAGWHQISFHHLEPTMPQNIAKAKQRSPWPPRGSQTRTSQPLIKLEGQTAERPHCSLETGFDEADLQELFESSKHMLCTNFDVLNLPQELHMAIQQYPIIQSFEVCDLDHYDRLLIFTDGSSKPSMRMLEAQHADEKGHPDTWAFIVIAERYIDPKDSEIVILGWTTHPVRYTEQGAAFMGIQRIGSDMAERAGLISAAMWRLSLNHQIPTVICTDSDTGGKQAFGLIGVQVPDESYKLMRSLYQAIELGLPHGALALHHTRSHMGDLFNEIADLAAKHEAEKSLNLPRQRLDLSRWRTKFCALWTLFGHKIGLPPWRHGFLDIEAPDLPSHREHQHVDEPSSQHDHCDIEHHALSLATANVQSLYRSPEGHAGKLQYLQEQMRHFHLNCMAIQEARSEVGMSSSNHILRLCGGHSDDQYGIEIWIDLQVPYAWSRHGHPRHFNKTHFQCLHHDPRSMLIRCDAPDLSFWLLALHAPHSGYPQQEREQWWETISELVRTHHDGDALFVLGDANAAPGCSDGLTVLKDGFATSASTSMLKQFLTEFKLYLPATSDAHIGTNTTWVDFQGTREHCIDHVALPQHWQARCTGSQVLPDFDLATLYDDHQVVAVQLQWSALLRRPGDRPQARPSRKAMTYSHDPSIADQLAQLEVLPWHVDVEQQAQHITQQLHDVMHQTTSAPATRRKKQYITDQAWSMRQTKCHLKKKIKQIKQRCKLDLLYGLFTAWRGKHQDAQDDSQHRYENMLRCKALLHAARLHAVSRQLKKEIMESKQKALRQKLEKFTIHTPAAEVLSQLKGFIGPTNPKKNKKKMLPIVRDEQGEVCQLPGDAVAVWVRFFQQMEGGERMPYHALRTQWIDELSQFRRTMVSLDMNSLPDLIDLELSMRRVPRGKAKGPDGVPGELLHHQPAGLARLMYPQLIKMIAHGQEHIGYKGGQLQPAYKGRGPVDSCSSYRSLLISSHLGKVLHRTIRQKQASLYEKFMQREQTGGRRKVPVQLALHQLRAFTRQAKRCNCSVAIIYLDLTEAFYTVVREAALGGEPSDAIIAHVLQRLNLPPEAMQDIYNLLAEPPALQQAGFSDVDQKCWQAVHTGTYFWLAEQNDVSRTRLGTRPGDSLADVVFGYAWGCVLKKLQHIMEEHDMITRFDVHDHLPLFASHNAVNATDTFVGPNWMDDLAVCLQAGHPQQLIHNASFVAGALLDLCAFHCLKPNLAKGKTEIQLTLRGPGSRKQRIQQFGPNAAGTIPVVCENGVRNIQLVQCYRHLGGAMHHTADQAREIHQRAAVAHAALNQHRRLLYQNKALDLEKRKELLDMLVMSKMLYGADSWVANDKRTLKSFGAKVINIYKRLLKLAHDQPILEEEILVRTALPSPQELLRRSRLRYFATLVTMDMPHVWGLLAQDQQWMDLLEGDMIWMWEQLKSTTKLPDPRQSYGHWLNLIQRSPKFWKRLVRRASEHCILQRCRVFRAREFHRQALERLWQIIPTAVARPFRIQLMDQEAFGCMGCGKRCKSRAGESVHMYKVHGLASNLRLLADQPTCSACLRYFHTMQKLQAHLYYSRRCREVLQDQSLVCNRVPGAGSTEDLARVAHHDRQLPPLRGEGPLPAPVPHRVFLDFDEGVFDFIVEEMIQNNDMELLERNIRQRVATLAITWTRFCATIKHFMDNFSEDDAHAFQVDFQQATRVLHELIQPSTWSFLNDARRCDESLPALEHLEEECALTRQHIEVMDIVKVPRLIGKHRIVLHAYAGRRRIGDIQYYMELFAKKQTDFTLHVISLDVVINRVWGDVSNPATCAYWIDAIRRQWVTAFIGGPPCETWSRARGKTTTYVDKDGIENTCKGPRIIRSRDQPWGFDSASIKELRQLCVGNGLLFFAIIAILELSATDGYGLLEHPAEPEQDPLAASIWRLEVMQTFLAMSHVRLERVAQGLLGSMSPKPTHLLALNLPQLMHHLHQGRVRKELPRATAIGRDSHGAWKTAPLKEYAPAFCRSVANSLMESFSGDTAGPSVADPPEDFLERCRLLEATEYSEALGQDYAG